MHVRFCIAQVMVINVPIEKLSVNRRVNLLSFVGKIERDMAAGQTGDIAAIEIDRKASGWS